jgi:phosphoribosylformimino-5-aminoimidazole carboxamide ribotide isomerase
VKIIPVIDLLNGEVVHAVRGEREKYRPVKSILTPGSNPTDIARALMSETGCMDIYIADLDAILKKGSNSKVFPSLKELGASLIVDAAANNVASVNAVKMACADKVIIGSETLFDINQLTEIIDKINGDSLIFSLDIRKGAVLSGAEGLKGVDPVKAIGNVVGKGIKDFIILTLDLVGSGEGPDTELIRMVRKEFPMLNLISGGGVKSPGHLDLLKAAGADSVLVATALHMGWIKRADILSHEIL